MNTSCRFPGPVVLLAAVFAQTPANIATGDSLTATTMKDIYYLFEPVVIKIGLTLDEPFVKVTGDPREASRQAARVRRELVAELRDTRGPLTEAMLGGGGFATSQDQARHFEATTIGILGDVARAGNDVVFRFWSEPGSFTLVVVDQEHGLRSNEVPITIIVPKGSEKAAAEMFESGGLPTLPALHGLEYGDKVRSLFERLAQQHPNTIYGKYARVSILLRRMEARRKGRTTVEPVALQDLASELREAVPEFDPGHPLRSRVLYYLASLQRTPGVEGDPQETLNQLQAETSDGQMLDMARELLADIASCCCLGG